MILQHKHNSHVISAFYKLVDFLNLILQLNIKFSQFHKWVSLFKWCFYSNIYYFTDAVFNYAPGTHTVVKVNGTGFQQCIISPSIGILTSGQDVIPLQTPGRKWYICGVGKHCESRNMKLVITVLPQTMVPAPSPMIVSTSSRLATPTFCGFVAALFVSLLLLFVWIKISHV